MNKQVSKTTIVFGIAFLAFVLVRTYYALRGSDFFSMGTLWTLGLWTVFALISYWVVSAAIIVIDRGRARWASRGRRA